VSRYTLSVQNLTVSRQRAGQEVTVVDRVSFNLGQGEVLAIVGESGCGKTKTAEAIMGLLPRNGWCVRADTIELDGKNLAGLSDAGMRKVRGRLVSMIFQEPLTALDPVFTVGNQLGSVFRRHRGQNPHQARASSAAMLEDVGFADTAHIMNSYPHQLSGGMRQRVMIAMAMACRPRVLIADEPTTALDVTTQAQVLSQLTRLGQEYGTSILLITHDPGVVAQYCDRAVVMLEGRAVEAATVQDLFNKPQHTYTTGLLASSPGAGMGR
jgi:ABC-type dipeptide/oligopeptide/nickel transport system ATPase component